MGALKNIIELKANSNLDTIIDASNNTLVASKLTNDQLSTILLCKDRIDKMLSSVEDEAINRISSGEHVDGYKVVNKRPKRVWNNQDTAERVLYSIYGKKIYSKEMLSIAKLEKLLGTTAIGDMFSYVSSGTKLAKED